MSWKSKRQKRYSRPPLDSNDECDAIRNSRSIICIYIYFKSYSIFAAIYER
jgi:hypothetical protein